MGFYDLDKNRRQLLLDKLSKDILADLNSTQKDHLLKYFSDSDTYIRKNAYLYIGRLYRNNEITKEKILVTLSNLLKNNNEKVRQTVVNALGEIGKKDADEVLKIYARAIFDSHHLVRNALIGSLKKMGEVNPKPVLQFAKKFLHHPNYHVRRQVIHGIELRGRTHPEDVLPVLKEVEFEQNRVVKNIIIHVLSQISYKQGCLEKVIDSLKTWKNKELVSKAINEILDVHKRYKNFSAKSYNDAKKYIEAHLN